jgi:hypothetical protein
MKKYQYRNSIVMLLAAGVMLLCLISCGAPKDDAKVNVIIQGASTVDNAIGVVLYAGPDGTQYFFEVIGTAGVDTTTFTLTVYLGNSTAGPVKHTAEFSLPNSEVDAQPGESGYGSVISTIYDNPGSYTTVIIQFVWSAIPPIVGNALVDLEFSHTPRILSWSATPASGAAAGEAIAIKAEVEFYGDGLSEGVTAQFWDNEAAGGSLVGTPGILSDPEADGIWTGTVNAVAGSDKLRISATDSEGSTVSEVYFVVP